MSSLKSFVIVAALLTGGTSLAIAQNGPQMHNLANIQGTSKTVSENGPPMHGSDTVIFIGCAAKGCLERPEQTSDQSKRCGLCCHDWHLRAEHRQDRADAKQGDSQ